MKTFCRKKWLHFSPDRLLFFCPIISFSLSDWRWKVLKRNLVSWNNRISNKNMSFKTQFHSQSFWWIFRSFHFTRSVFTRNMRKKIANLPDANVFLYLTFISHYFFFSLVLSSLSLFNSLFSYLIFLFCHLSISSLSIMSF